MTSPARPSSVSVLSRLAERGAAPGPVRLPGPRPGPVGRMAGARYTVGDEEEEAHDRILLSAYDHDLQREVTLRVLHPSRADDAGAVADLVRAAQVWGQLQHPHILPVYELGLMADRRPFVSTRRFPGRTLDTVLRSTPGDAAGHRRLRLFEQVSQGVAYAHARGVVHGHLDAHSVLVGDFGEVQIVGWERATPLPVEDCASPPDLRADVDALGRLLADQADGDPFLAQLADDCLSEDPTLRPTSAATVADRIGHHIADQEARAERARLDAFEAQVRARQATLQAEAERRSRRRQATLLLIVFVMILGGSFGWTRIQAAEGERRDAADRLVDDHMERSALLFQQGAVRKAAIEARTGVALGIDRGASGAVLQRARATAEDLEGRVRALDAQAALDASNADLLQRLDDIAGLRDIGRGIEETVVETRAVLHDHGVDPYEVGPDAAAAMLLARGDTVADTVSEHLDLWAAELALSGDLPGQAGLPDWHVFARTAALITTDPVRELTRDYLETRDFDTLAESSLAVDVASAPPRSLAILAQELQTERPGMVIARDLLRRAWPYHPDNWWLHWRLAHFATVASPAESLLHYEAALALDPGNAMALGGIAWQAWRRGEAQRALELAERAIEGNPRRPAPLAFIVKGTVLGSRGESAAAIECFRRATEILPSWGWAWSLLGVALNRQGRRVEALSAFERAVAINPNNDEMVGSYAWILHEVGRSEEAARILRRHIDSGTAGPEIPFNLAAIDAAMGRWSDALAVLEADVRAWPRDGRVQNQLAYYLAVAPEGLQDLPRAAEVAATARDLLPKGPYPWGTSGIVAYLRGDPVRAVERLRRSRELNAHPGSADAHESLLWLAASLRAVGEVQEAHEIWSGVLAWRKAQPDSRLLWFFDRAVATLEPELR